MDAKALAKSKRAHSQHHSKKPNHPAHKLKAPAVSSENPRDKKKPSLNQDVDKAQQSRRVSALPSNWDRYDVEFDSDPENPSGDRLTSQSSDVVVPKSKGADYCHLIAEAQADSDSKLNLYSNNLPSIDDVLPDEFSQLVGSMLSVRGEGILSWVGDDNFIVDDGKASNHEAAFLSMNLNTLAEQLEKVNLHQRFFIEADILPPELCTDGSQASSDQVSCQPQAAQESETTATEDLTRQVSTMDLKNGDESIKPSLRVLPNDIHYSASREPMSNPVNQDKDESRSIPIEEPSNFEFDVKLAANTNKKFSTFEASSAEAELDILLDSKYHEPLSLSSANASEFTQKEAPKLRRPQILATTGGSSVPVPAANFDDVLDNLLEQTSTQVKPKGVIEGSENHTFSQSVGKSKVLDDFDSWLDTI